MKRHYHLSLALVLVLLPAARADDIQMLCDFESSELPRLWDYGSGAPRLVGEGALEGGQSLEIAFDRKAQYNGAYLSSSRLPRDWSAYDALVVDVFNPQPEPVTASVLIADQAWRDRGSTYWNRHNAQRSLPPGRTEWIIPLGGLFRGEAGSRNNDIASDIDVDSIVRVDFGFGQRGQDGRILIDAVRLVKSARPEGIWAFDFGPSSQSLMLGWTAVAHDTRYASERGYGWGPQRGTPWNGAARDTTFGPVLLQDSCEAGGYQFRIDVPPGRYRATVFYENSGYWGGEQAMHGERRILVDGKTAWEERRPDGSAHALYRFEDVEPIGVDLWDTYMKAELARPVVFETSAGREGLTLRFEADRVWGSKVAAVAVHGADDDRASVWLAGQLEKVADEFRSQAVCLDPPAEQFTPSAAWEKVGLAAWSIGIEDEITPQSVPASLADSPGSLTISRLAVRDEFEPFCVGLRPLRDLGECRLELEPWSGPGSLSAEIGVVRYQATRGFGNIAYRIQPHTVRPETSLSLPKDISREVIVTVLVRRETLPGLYQGALLVKDSAGGGLLRVPLRLDVRPVTLDREIDFLMGFFGLMPPGMIPEGKQSEVLEQTLRMLREHGMNAVSGGPNWRLAGWKDGRPRIDYGEMDRFFALLKQYGFDRPLNGYGGARFLGLNDGYEQGRTAEKVERESGLKYEEALMRAWKAVDEHARQAGWPTIYHAMCDETRVRERAERELEFMKVMAKVSEAFPRTVRTSGSYSVDFRKRPADSDDMLYWHQRFFEALDISSLNLHDPSVMAEAEKLGKEIHIYNQGRSRFSFGLYQWSEFRKGVAARWQWHLNILHGYQFFDLDGREPDTAMICYGRARIYPTIHFERCREGAEDFYLCQTLWNLVEQKRPGSDEQAIADARALLERAVAEVPLNHRESPKGFDADRFKAGVVSAIERIGRQ